MAAGVGRAAAVCRSSAAAADHGLPAGTATGDESSTRLPLTTTAHAPPPPQQTHAELQEEIILDVEVPGGYDDRRLAAIQRGLVAHGALLQLLKRVDFPHPLPTKLIDAIIAAKELGLIGEPAW